MTERPHLGTPWQRWLLRWDRFLQHLFEDDESCGHIPNEVGVRECVRRYRHRGRHIYREVP